MRDLAIISDNKEPFVFALPHFQWSGRQFKLSISDAAPHVEQSRSDQAATPDEAKP